MRGGPKKSIDRVKVNGEGRKILDNLSKDASAQGVSANIDK